MPSFDTANALSLLGKNVQVELHWSEDPRPLIYRVRIVGVALTLEDEQPYFLTRDPAEPQRFPDELFWNDIQSLSVLEDAAGNGQG
ncbi:hypothetical protein ACOXVJ_06275 [Pseudomonas knackmussii]|uniref:hypothetical protein n=1 Tax=Pseudomonas knackmussii TaxID=65741 RepID=UPI003BE245EE